MELSQTSDKKLKIVFISDHPLATSGVGVQARFLIDGLLKTGKYTFRCLGGAMKHPSYETIVVNPDFIIKPVDGFGDKEMLRQILATEKPDAVFLFTDPRQFIWVWEMEEEVHQFCPIVYWHVWDNDPYPAYNAVLYDSTDLINCLSHKTFEIVSPSFPDRTNYIPHAFPKEVYYPMPKEKQLELKAQHLGDKKDWFTALWVNRNAARKMPADLLEGWKQFLDILEEKEGHRKAVMIMHTDPVDIEGPNLYVVSEMLGLTNNVWFSPNRVGFEEMNIMHNMSDVCINISKNEGFGLSTLISMQCGKPIIALKTGGMTRQVVDYRDGSEHGVAIEPVTRKLVGSQMVPYIYEDFAQQKDVAEAFYKLYKMSQEEKEALSAKLLSYVDHEFNYENVVKEWDRTLYNCVMNWKNNSNKKWTLTNINPIPVKNTQLPQKSLETSKLPTKKPINMSELLKSKMAKGNK